MPISGSRVRSFLVLLWTTMTALAVLFYTAMFFVVPEHRAPLGLGLMELKGRTAVGASVFIGIWGLTALVLLSRGNKLGPQLLLMYSACGFVSTGGWLVLDLLFEFHRPPIGLPNYGLWLFTVIAFFLTARWSWNRVFANKTNDLSISTD